MRAKIILFFRFLLIDIPPIFIALEKGDKSDTFLYVFHYHFFVMKKTPVLYHISLI